MVEMMGPEPMDFMIATSSAYRYSIAAERCFTYEAHINSKAKTVVDTYERT